MKLRLEVHVAGCCLGSPFPKFSLSVSLPVAVHLFVCELGRTKEFRSKG